MESRFTLEDIKGIQNRMDTLKRPGNLKLSFSLKEWKTARWAGTDWAQWTDKQLKDRNKKTGLIGTKLGIDCYVHSDNLGFAPEPYKMT